MVKPGRRGTLNPGPKLGPVLVQLLQDHDIHGFLALGRLTQPNAGEVRVIVEGDDTVVVVTSGTKRQFCVPADVVKSA